MWVSVAELVPTHNGFLGKVQVNSSPLISNDSYSKNFLNTIKLNVPTPNVPCTVLILDVSGSMYLAAQSFASTIFPAMLDKLGYSRVDKVTLITFSDWVDATDLTVDELRNYEVSDQGGTFMAGVIPCLSKVLMDLPATSTVRILTLSDGELFDVEQTIAAANELAASVMNLSLSISSHAVRYGGQVDTRALCSILQLNSTGRVSSLVEINSLSCESSVVSSIASVFENDGLCNVMHGSVTKNVVVSSPWMKDSATSTFMIFPEIMNYVWFTEPVASIIIEGEVIPLQSQPVMYGKEFYDQFKPLIDSITQRAKMLMLLNTNDGSEELQGMVQYFSDLEAMFYQMEEKAEESRPEGLEGLKFRAAMIKSRLAKTSRSVNRILAEIANDSQITKLNSQQAAEYLRALTSSRSAKGLARRAANSSYDFDGVVVSEAKAMRKHLSELNSIDDSNHAVSYVSFDTTLGGIKSVCALVDEGLIDYASHLDILALLNIVGIPCTGPIGDFPDAMTYRIQSMHFDCHASISDLILLQKLSISVSPISGIW